MELWEEYKACCQKSIQDTVKLRQREESEGKGMSRGDTD